MGTFDSFRNIWKNLSNLNKEFTETTSRPAIMQPYMATDTGAKLPIFPFPLIMIYELADNIDALRIPIETLNREIFKNGWEVVEKYKYKCQNCGKEFDLKPVAGESDDDLPGMEGAPEKGPSAKPQKDQDVQKDDATAGGDALRQGTDKEKKKKESVECDSCGATDLIRPVPENRKILENLYKKPINNNEQTITQVMRMIERDLEIADNAYLLLLKNYWIDPSTRKIVPEKSEIKEILRIDPPQVAMIADSDGRIGYDDKRIPVYVCPKFEHRDKRLTKPICPRCGTYAIKAVVEVSSVYSIGIPQPKRVIYGEGEVIWKAGKYKPGLIYGFSPIYAVWSKVMSLSHMDEYIRKYFDKMRPPRGLLVIASRNYETFRKAWGQLEKHATEDPYMIHPLMVESEKGGRNMAQWIDFTGSLKELQFIDIRRELRMIIGAIYGVLPLYFGELPSGWSQEGLQVTITNRAVKWGQDILLEAFLGRIAHEVGVEDWDLRLKPGEEADALRELETEGQKLTNMQAYQAMGFPIERTHQGDWKIGKKPDFEQNMMALPPDPMGGEGGEGKGNTSGKQGGKPSGGKPKDRGGAGRGQSTTGDKEKVKPTGGSPKRTRPSDPGGVGQGHPSPGGKRSGSFNASQKDAAALSEPKKLEGLEEVEKPDKVVKETYQPMYPDKPREGDVKIEKPENKPKKTKYNITHKKDGSIDVVREDYHA